MRLSDSLRSQAQAHHAEQVCHTLDIPFQIMDLRKVFGRYVIDYFCQEYQHGWTPNPCIACNQHIKFGALLNKVLSQGIDYIATGHYARISQSHGPELKLRAQRGGSEITEDFAKDNLQPLKQVQGKYHLLKGVDVSKDQSYFLYRLSQAQLAQTLLPLGDSSKEASRRWAEAAGFAPLIEPESQEICFIPGGHYADFLRRQAASNAGNDDGPIVDRDGTVLGRHHGIFNYTIGQRRGLGIPSTEPYYVLTIEPETHTVVVGRAGDLNVSECRVREVHWVSIEPSERPIDAQVRIRNQHRPAAAIIEPTADDAVRVRFETPQRAVTPGQAAVFYQGDLLLGGGTIAHQEP